MATDNTGKVPSLTIQKALTKCQGVCNDVLPQIEYFEELAKVMTEIDPLVTELRLKHEHLDKLSRVGLLQCKACEA